MKTQGPFPYTPETLDADLARYLATVEEDIECLTEPELGPLGADLLKAFRATGATEHLDPYMREGGAYKSHDYDEDSRTKFVNRIYYSRNTLDIPPFLLMCKIHEMTHALQFNRCAALHAGPENLDATVILCPRDYMMIRRWIEKDAYTTEALMGSAAARTLHPHLRSLYDHHAANITMFEYMREKEGLEKALAWSINNCLRMFLSTAFNTAGNAPRTYGDLYDRNNLDFYKKILIHLDGSHKILVRIDERDYREVLSAFAPGLSYTDLKIPGQGHKDIELSPENKKTLDALNALIGIRDERDLPFLRDVAPDFKIPKPVRPALPVP